MKKAVFSLLMTCLVAVLLPSSTGVLAEGGDEGTATVEGWAVIVGISHYNDFAEALYCRGDAEDLYAQLAPIWGEDHIKLLVDNEATKANIKDAIRNWLRPREDEDDVVLFFFSGQVIGKVPTDPFFRHSIYEGKVVTYLSPHDSLINSFNNSIAPWEMAGYLNTLDSENVVTILDTPGASGFITALSSSGRVILAACGGNEAVWYSDALGHRIFSYYLLEAFDNVELVDTSGDYEISAEEIFNYVHPLVTSFESTQHPVLGDSHAGELVLGIMATFDADPREISLTVDGTTYSPGELPTSFLWLPGSVHDCDAPSSMSGETGTQYLFTSWSDGNTSPSRTVSQEGEYTANYITQHYLTIESDYGNPQGEGWYDSGSTATISVTSPHGVIIRHAFSGWSGDSTATTSTATILMDEPTAVTANWRTDYIQLYILIGGIVGLAGVVSASVILIIKRRKASP